jgi:hypothetical protein
MSWSVEEFREERRRIAKNREVAERIAASKARREAREKPERAAREAARFAIQHGLDPARIYEPQPRVMMSAFGGLRPGPRPEELARKSRRADEIIAEIRRTKAEERPAVHRAAKPEPPRPQRIVRTSGQVLDVY